MKIKKILGIIFIALALLLTLAFVGQLPALFQVIINFFAAFTGKLYSSQIGEVFGHLNLLGWAFYANNRPLGIRNTLGEEKKGNNV